MVDWQEVVVNLIYTFLMASIPAIVGIVVMYLKKKLNITEQNAVYNTVSTVVQAAEMWGAANKAAAEEKKQWAYEKLREALPGVTEDMLDALIEKAVYELKAWGGELKPSPDADGHAIRANTDTSLLSKLNN